MWPALAAHTGDSTAVSVLPLSPVGSPIAANITNNSSIVPNNLKLISLLIYMNLFLIICNFLY
jgi:hypothetical protein